MSRPGKNDHEVGNNTPLPPGRPTVESPGQKRDRQEYDRQRARKAGGLDDDDNAQGPPRKVYKGMNYAPQAEAANSLFGDEYDNNDADAQVHDEAEHQQGPSGHGDLASADDEDDDEVDDDDCPGLGDFNDPDLYAKLVGDDSESTSHERHSFQGGAGGGGGGGGGGGQRSRGGPTRMDNMNGEARNEKILNFRGYDFEVYRAMIGEDIEEDPREAKLLKKCDRKFDPATALARVPGNTLQACDDDEGSSLFGREENDHFMVKRLACRLCQHTTGTIPARFSVGNAYQEMVKIDYRLCGYIPDATLFQTMMSVFNRNQASVKKRGGQAFFVSVREVKDHFMYHDQTSPLRPLVNQLRLVNEILAEGRKYIFGETEGRDFWNGPKTTRLLQVMRQQKELVRDLTQIRSRVNPSMSEQDANDGGKAVSRHANGPTTRKGRYNN
jgi:hypothetical protein